MAQTYVPPLGQAHRPRCPCAPRCWPRRHALPQGLWELHPKAGTSPQTPPGGQRKPPAPAPAPPSELWGQEAEGGPGIQHVPLCLWQRRARGTACGVSSRTSRPCPEPRAAAHHDGLAPRTPVTQRPSSHGRSFPRWGCSPAWGAFGDAGVQARVEQTPELCFWAAADSAHADPGPVPPDGPPGTGPQTGPWQSPPGASGTRASPRAEVRDNGPLPAPESFRGARGLIKQRPRSCLSAREVGRGGRRGRPLYKASEAATRSTGAASLPGVSGGRLGPAETASPPPCWALGCCCCCGAGEPCSAPVSGRQGLGARQTSAPGLGVSGPRASGLGQKRAGHQIWPRPGSPRPARVRGCQRGRAVFSEAQAGWTGLRLSPPPHGS